MVLRQFAFSCSLFTAAGKTYTHVFIAVERKMLDTPAGVKFGPLQSYVQRHTEHHFRLVVHLTETCLSRVGHDEWNTLKLP